MATTLDTPVTAEFVLNRLQLAYTALAQAGARIKADLVEPGDEHPREGTCPHLLKAWDRLTTAAYGVRQAAREIEPSGGVAGTDAVGK